MYEYVRNELSDELKYIVLDENNGQVAYVRCEEDAREIVAAWRLVEEALEKFPGLYDGTTPVNGGDLVELFSSLLEYDVNGRFKVRDKR